MFLRMSRRCWPWARRSAPMSLVVGSGRSGLSVACAALQVAADVAPACRVLPHALAALATSPPVRKLPLQDALLLALLRLSHQQACSATETTAAASPLYATGAESSSSRGSADGSDEPGRPAAGGVGRGWHGNGPQLWGGRFAGSGKAVADPWADDTVLDRLLVGIVNGRDVASAAALHALCSVYRGMRESLVQHIHSDEWCVLLAWCQRSAGMHWWNRRRWKAHCLAGRPQPLVCRGRGTPSPELFIFCWLHR